MLQKAEAPKTSPNEKLLDTLLDLKRQSVIVRYDGNKEILTL